MSSLRPFEKVCGYIKRSDVRKKQIPVVVAVVKMQVLTLCGLMKGHQKRRPAGFVGLFDQSNISTLPVAVLL